MLIASTRLFCFRATFGATKFHKLRNFGYWSPEAARFAVFANCLKWEVIALLKAEITAAGLKVAVQDTLVAC